MRIYLKRVVFLTVLLILGYLFITILIGNKTTLCSDCITNSVLSMDNSTVGIFTDSSTSVPTVWNNSYTELLTMTGLSVAQIKVLAAEMNSNQRIQNLDKFGLKLHDNSVVILIQVHSRVDTLVAVVESLRHVRFINETLVIFSHDIYSKNIFKIVQSIDFCPMMQICYPFALQTHKNVFPGFHPNDCPRNLNIMSARKRRCNNAEYQDKFKHYREGHVCQIKHHWLWKMHFAFDRLRILAGFNGTLLRLDDDYYLADDVIYFIRKLDLYRKKSYPDCRMYIMGDHERFSEAPFRTAANGVLKASYYVGIGRGMAFRREFWEAFKNCSKSFCTHDEYNWDFALHRIAATCMRGGLTVLKPVASRVFHVGTCLGFHRKINNCRLETVKKNIQQLLHTVSANLFPDKISVIKAKRAARPATRQYGGWADPRDHRLCLNIFNNVSDDEAILAQIHNTLRHPANRTRLKE